MFQTSVTRESNYSDSQLSLVVLSGQRVTVRCAWPVYIQSQLELPSICRQKGAALACKCQKTDEKLSDLEVL